MHTQGVRKRLLEVDDMIQHQNEIAPVFFNIEIPKIVEEESDKEDEARSKPKLGSGLIDKQFTFSYKGRQSDASSPMNARIQSPIFCLDVEKKQPSTNKNSSGGFESLTNFADAVSNLEVPISTNLRSKRRIDGGPP